MTTSLVEGANPVVGELVIRREYDVMLAEIRRRLESAGLRVQQSFDLRSALLEVLNCRCPHHGTARCTCQYGVLLVYGQGGGPATLQAHGRDGLFWLTLAPASFPQIPRDLESAIVQALTNLGLVDASQWTDRDAAVAASD